MTEAGGLTWGRRWKGRTPFNRNWDREFDVPIGPDNLIEPAGPDQGQPSHFFPRRNQFAFGVDVPADFGDREVVWMLTTNGITERAYATLHRSTP